MWGRRAAWSRLRWWPFKTNGSCTFRTVSNSILRTLPHPQLVLNYFESPDKPDFCPTLIVYFFPHHLLIVVFAQTTRQLFVSEKFVTIAVDCRRVFVYLFIRCVWVNPSEQVICCRPTTSVEQWKCCWHVRLERTTKRRLEDYLLRAQMFVVLSVASGHNSGVLHHPNVYFLPPSIRLFM